MNYIFPYNLVEKGSKVAIYGFGKVGQDFFEQIIAMDYCECVLCVDKSFESYENIHSPFGRIKDLEVVAYDYLIIAAYTPKLAGEIREILKNMNIDPNKIIWSPFYAMKSIWPNNKRQYLENPKFYLDITKKYRIANSIYGGGEFYQSYSEIGLSGTRNIQERIHIYQAKKYLKSTDDVLDIGCNCGFLDLQLSEYVKSIKGIDVEPLFIEIANQTKAYVGVSNVQFSVMDFREEVENANIKYDVIFSLAVHTNVFQTGIAERQFVDDIISKLKDGGILFFESHDLVNDRERFDRICGIFQNAGMKILERENYFSDFDRDIIVMKK